jgi:hypothetical protein
MLGATAIANNAITDIKKDDVQVMEGDLPGRIKSFRGPATQAANVILVMDVSGSMAQQNRIGGFTLSEYGLSTLVLCNSSPGPDRCEERLRIETPTFHARHPGFGNRAKPIRSPPAMILS